MSMSVGMLSVMTMPIELDQTSGLLVKRLSEHAKRMSISLSEVQLKQLVTYLEQLARWNSTINLTALPLQGFPDKTLDRLVGESMRASRWWKSPIEWIDLGSGGGS